MLLLVQNHIYIIIAKLRLFVCWLCFYAWTTEAIVIKLCTLCCHNVQSSSKLRRVPFIPRESKGRELWATTSIWWIYINSPLRYFKVILTDLKRGGYQLDLYVSLYESLNNWVKFHKCMCVCMYVCLSANFSETRNLIAKIIYTSYMKLTLNRVNSFQDMSL